MITRWTVLAAAAALYGASMVLPMIYVFITPTPGWVIAADVLAWGAIIAHIGNSGAIIYLVGHLAWWLGCVLLGFGKGRPAGALAILAVAGVAYAAVQIVSFPVGFGEGYFAWAGSCAVLMLGSFAVGNIRAEQHAEPAYPVTPTDGGR
jgi:hypothetical protein